MLKNLAIGSSFSDAGIWTADALKHEHNPSTVPSYVASIISLQQIVASKASLDEGRRKDQDSSDVTNDTTGQ